MPAFLLLRVFAFPARRGPALRAHPRWHLIFLLAAVLPLVGCRSTQWVSLRSAPRNPLVDRLQFSTFGGPQPTDRTGQLLRVYHLQDEYRGDLRKLLEKFQQVVDQEPAADKVYALAELAYLGARRMEASEKDHARDLYGSAVLHAYRYLFDPRFASGRNPYDPQFRGACEIYNSALEAALRIENQGNRLLPGHTATIQTAAGPWDIHCVLRSGGWRDEEFEKFDFVSSYEIHGLKNQYQTYGLGVPLIAVRKSYPGEPPAAKYYPNRLSFPVTAFLRPLGVDRSTSSTDSQRSRAVLELYDPLATADLVIAQTRVPLESDLSTSLAYFLRDFNQDDMATKGFLDPDVLLAMRPGRKTPVMGLYMVQPYEPGKIPVLLVHGLWSSPMTWMQIFNDLRSSPEIRNRYQFWFYLYPTGQPFWISAAQLRTDLADARQVLDPNGQEPALDQMVLVGHSMGGLVSLLQTISGGDDYWQLVSRRALPELKADDELRGRLEHCFYFQPSPSIRRVVTIATPHHGTRYSNQTTQWLLSQLIKLPQRFTQSQERLFRDNPEAFAGASLLRVATSVDSLAPEQPIFPTLAHSRRPPWVRYHTVIGSVPAHGLFGSLAAGSDGVVTVQSAHLEGADSELIVPASHMSVHSHPLAVLEVRRILMEHLAELESFPAVRQVSKAPVVR